MTDSGLLAKGLVCPQALHDEVYETAHLGRPVPAFAMYDMDRQTSTFAVIQHRLQFPGGKLRCHLI